MTEEPTSPLEVPEPPDKGTSAEAPSRPDELFPDLDAVIGDNVAGHVVDTTADEAASTLVAEAIDHFGLQVAEVHPVTGSYSSTVRMLTLASGERLVLKIPYVQRKLFRELRALDALRGSLPVPTVLASWVRDDGGPGAMLLSLLPGAPIRGLVTPNLAHQMGELLARLHLHDVDHFGDEFEGADAAAGDWWGMLRDHFERWRPLCRQVMPPDLYHRAVGRYAALAADLPAPDGPRWVHFDFRPGNILVDFPPGDAPAQITGLIDFESARGGSADLDFVKVSHRVWDVVPRTQHAFLEGYASVRPVPNVAHTLPFYRLHNALGGIAWCVRRSSTADPFFRENLMLLQHELDEETAQ